MKKTIYILVAFICLLPINIKAACSNSEVVRLRKLANNIKYTYDYSEANNSVTFNIGLTNVQPDFKIKDVSTKQEYQDFGSEIVLYGYAPGKGYRFDVYTKDTTCTKQKLASIYITLPYYNSFYSNELCNGIENYKLCQKWTKNNYSYEESVKRVNNYIASKNSKTENNEIDKKNIKGIYDYILDFYLKTYFILLPIIIVVCLTIIYRINKKNRLF